MRSWKEAFEEHFIKHLGAPKQRFVGRVAVAEENEVLVFDFHDGRRAFCSLGTSDHWIGGVKEEFITLAVAEDVAEVAYVFINSIREMKRCLFAEGTPRVVALQRRVCPESIKNWRKTPVVVRSGFNERLPPGLREATNGPRLGLVREVAFLTAADRGFLQERALPALEEVFATAGTDLTDLVRSSAVDEKFGRVAKPPARWLPSLVVSKASERKVLELGAQRSGDTWYVPANLDPFVFDRWLSPESRAHLAQTGPLQLLPAPAGPRRLKPVSDTAPRPNTTSPAAEPQLLTYRFTDRLGAVVSHESEMRVLRDSVIEFEGKCYAVSGTTGKRIDCEEVPPPFFEASRTAFADEVSSFLAKRGHDAARMTEDTLKEAVLGILARWFAVELEVWGTHPTGRRMRIDAVLRPKASEPWRTKEIAIGIEFKNPAATKSQASRDGAVMAQTLDYAMCEFEGYGEILVFVCPTPAHLRSEVTLFRFLAQYGVGYVELETKRGITFYLGEMSRILWSEVEGVAHLGRAADLCRKYGNRGRRR